MAFAWAKSDYVVKPTRCRNNRNQLLRSEYSEITSYLNYFFKNSWLNTFEWNISNLKSTLWEMLQNKISHLFTANVCDWSPITVNSNNQTVHFQSQRTSQAKSSAAILHAISHVTTFYFHKETLLNRETEQQKRETNVTSNQMTSEYKA